METVPYRFLRHSNYLKSCRGSLGIWLVHVYENGERLFLNSAFIVNGMLFVVLCLVIRTGIVKGSSL